MEKHNYKIIENREEPPEKEILAGMNFATVAAGAFITKKGSVNGLIIAGISFVVIIIAVILYVISSEEKSPEKKTTATDTTESVLIIEDSKENVSIAPKEITIAEKKTKTDTSSIKKNSTLVVIEETVEETSSTNEQASVPFRQRVYADMNYAIEIKDSIYGPVNVSVGYGDVREFKDNSSKVAMEENSAWFKFTVKKDTMLTFHIVPKLKTDNFDFVLFKCTNLRSCEKEILQSRLKPVKSSFSWNTSQNCNTGLSLKAKDTLFQAVNFKGEGQGRTYESALKVKAGDVFYLMVTDNLGMHQDPEGFMIYFYNYIPKRKLNTYK